MVLVANGGESPLMPPALYALVLAAIALLVLAAAFLERRFFLAGYLFVLMRNLPYPWYVLWSPPYLSRRAARI